MYIQYAHLSVYTGIHWHMYPDQLHAAVQVHIMFLYTVHALHRTRLLVKPAIHTDACRNHITIQFG